MDSESEFESSLSGEELLEDQLTRIRDRKRASQSLHGSIDPSDVDSMAGNPPSEPEQDESGDDTTPPHERYERHPTAGQSHGEGTTVLEDIALNNFVEERKSNIYYPFANQDDWEVAAWISNSGLSTRDINAFLQLTFVSALVPVLLRANHSSRSSGQTFYRSQPPSSFTTFSQRCRHHRNGNLERLLLRVALRRRLSNYFTGTLSKFFVSFMAIQFTKIINATSPFVKGTTIGFEY